LGDTPKPLDTRRGLRSWLRRHDQAVFAYIFMTPILLHLLIFVAFPLVYSMWLSLQDATGFVGQEKFIGLANYRTLVASTEFWRVVGQTAYFVVGSVPVRLVLGLAIALLLDQKIRGRTFYRLLFFSPYVTSLVAVSVIWVWIFDPTWGLLDYALSLVKLPQLQWLASPAEAMPAIIIVAVWKSVGFTMLIYLAGLQGVPTHYYEAAKVDGANALARFRSITWPLLLPTTFFLLVTEIIGSSQVFDVVFVMTGGGPIQATRVIVFYLYQYAFQFFKLGFASAVAWVLFVFIMVITLTQWFLFPGRDQTVD
jgi:multiple sugar transport system permease protein